MVGWRDRERGFSTLHDVNGEREDDGAMKVEPQSIGAPMESASNDVTPTSSPTNVGQSFNGGSSSSRRAKTAELTLPGIEIRSIGNKTDVRRSRAQRCLFRTAFTVRFLVKLLGVGIMGLVLFVAVMNWPPWAIEKDDVRHQVMSTLFVSALFIVAVEDFVGINKSAIMLLLAATMWTFLAVGYHPTKSKHGAHELHHELDKGLKDVGSVILFLLPAMGVVESIDHFDGFAIVTAAIRLGMKGHPRRLMPIICILTFFLSSVIDNLTATIVALKILRHLVDDEEYRRECGSLAVLASNAGGAWSPIGDVTTTMLWIASKITTGKTVAWLFFPSFVAGVLPLGGIMWQSQRRQEQAKASATPQSTRELATMEEQKRRSSNGNNHKAQSEETQSMTASGDAASYDYGEGITRTKVFALMLGIFCILLVPVLKMSTGLPPYLGMLLALAWMWLITDFGGFGVAEHSAEESLSPGSALSHHSGPPQGGVVMALKKVDLTGLLFFTGVLLSVGALDSAGVLKEYATRLVATTGHSPVALCTLLGLSSAVVDNVPLVEATIDMFRQVGKNEPLWQLIALAAGTGGSVLSIGSIAGVTLMSMEGVGFVWYLQRISLWAILGFGAGILTYQLQRIVVYGF